VDSLVNQPVEGCVGVLDDLREVVAPLALQLPEDGAGMREAAHEEEKDELALELLDLSQPVCVVVGEA